MSPECGAPLDTVAEEPCRLLAVGRVTSLHGVRGGLKVLPYSGHPEQLCVYKRFFLSPGGPEKDGHYTVTHCGRVGRMALLELAGVTDRERAEPLVGSVVHVLKNDLPAVAENEFYLHELEGRLVETIDGQRLGRVAGFLITGGSELLVIKNNKGQELFVPAVSAFLRGMDEETIRVELPLGFIDIQR